MESKKTSNSNKGDKTNKKKLIYPLRSDEIGILSNQIQLMSNELKSQINQLEKFSSDVAHELKNPLGTLVNLHHFFDPKVIQAPENKEGFEILKEESKLASCVLFIFKFLSFKCIF